MIYGYARVSSTDQNLDRQLETLQNFNCDVIYTDKMSGKNFDRAEYQKLKKALKKGDLLIIKSIDRLGRNYDMIIDEWREITHNIEADIYVTDMPLLDTRTEGKNLVGKFISDIVLQILSFVAENERENIKKRQAEGIRIAKEKGRHLGRPKKTLPNNFIDICNKWFNFEISISEAIKETGLARAVFYKYAVENGFKRIKKTKVYTKKPTYIIEGAFIHKIVSNKKSVCQELKISSSTLEKYFRGENTIINRMGLKIDKGE